MRLCQDFSGDSLKRFLLAKDRAVGIRKAKSDEELCMMLKSKNSYRYEKFKAAW
jgi:hypothetical protein